jgi:magnesium-transporting ATPase (P-type)
MNRPVSRTVALAYNLLFSICCDFRLAFFPGNEFLLKGKTAKRKAEEFLLQPKKSVCVLKESYFFFAVFFAAFFAGAFFAGIICSPPFFHVNSPTILLQKNQPILFISDRMQFVNRNITFLNTWCIFVNNKS